jgi:chemotaxis protein CheY-P-specific phosphatase CheC
MSLSDSAQQALLRIIEGGMNASADKLAQISHTRWQMQTTSISTTPLERIEPLLSSGGKDHYGAYFSMPGGIFLVMLPQQSGSAMADAYLSRTGKSPQSQSELVQEAVAEISNVVVNAVAATLADACDMVFFLSAPEITYGKKEDILAEAPKKFKSSGENFSIMTYVHMSSPSLSSDCTVVILLNSRWKDRLLQALD